MLTSFLNVIHVIVGLFLILVVLLQQGKGGGLGGLGGGAATQVFGGGGLTIQLASVLEKSSFMQPLSQHTTASVPLECSVGSAGTHGTARVGTRAADGRCLGWASAVDATRTITSGTQRAIPSTYHGSCRFVR